ncbi:MAG: hypothetical protein ACRYFX_17375 [Janthinobacterium lividum]
MKKLLFLPLAAALFASGGLLSGCNPTTSTSQAPATPAEQVKAATDSVLALHERLMPQADEAVALAAKLQATPNPPHALVVKLSAADQAMMTWMHTYQPPDSTAPAPQRLAYLREQQRQLNVIDQQLHASLTAGAAALRQLPAAPAPTTPAPARR